MNPPMENTGPKPFYTQEYAGSVWLPYALPHTCNREKLAPYSMVYYSNLDKSAGIIREEKTR